ncbi:MAG TPA: hypothetical protein VF179_13355, partial [Thermoanaerobaculia bacterium]|nr:hypothetical protein [Thermoanaerobaculia bacterium]
TAAMGEWNANQGVRPEVAADWRVAILGTRIDTKGEQSSTYMLGVLLSKDPDLAFEWLVARLRDPERPRFTHEPSPYALALSALKRDQRIKLVEELERGGVPEGFVRLLVEKDPEVFKRVLSSENLREQHLEPLNYLPDDTGIWMDLAVLALEGKHELDRILETALWPSGRARQVQLWRMSEHWQKHEQAFARFAEDPRKQVRAIALRGQQLAAEERQEAQKNEREFAVHGPSDELFGKILRQTGRSRTPYPER